MRHQARGIAATAMLLLLLGWAGAGYAGAAEATYKLPWENGATYGVAQGNNSVNTAGKCVSGCYTHAFDAFEHFAWDFDLPEHTRVVAARSGHVALVKADWPADHCGGKSPIVNQPTNYVVSSTIGNEANYLVIDHGDGTSALYLHLSEVSQAVKDKKANGGTVQQGEELGFSGKTGWTQCDPHLHFQVQKTGASWYTESVAIRFSDPDVLAKSPDGVPQQSQSYTSGNGPPAGQASRKSAVPQPPRQASARQQNQGKSTPGGPQQRSSPPVAVAPVPQPVGTPAHPTTTEAPQSKAAAASSTIRMGRVWTRNGKGNDQTSFSCGDQIRFSLELTNPNDVPVRANIAFLADNSSRSLYNYDQTVSIPPGVARYESPLTTSTSVNGEFTYTAIITPTGGLPKVQGSGEFSIGCAL